MGCPSKYADFVGLFSIFCIFSFEFRERQKRHRGCDFGPDLSLGCMLQGVLSKAGNET